jgi:hypothetical protein
MKKTETIDLKGKSYATVPARLKEFRKDNPRGLIETNPTIQADGTLIFKAHILTDKSNPDSPEATGHAFGKGKAEKDFEKTETIAVGRALALLGYMASGDIASSEEMEEFEDYKKNQKQILIENAIEKINDTKTLEELKTVWTSLGNLIIEKEIQEAKELQKTKLTK